MRSCLSRRDALLLGGAASVGLATRGLLLPSAYAQQPQPKRGGVMHVAEDDSSTADTLDPARANNDTDYCRLFMFYNGLTVFMNTSSRSLTSRRRWKPRMPRSGPSSYAAA